MGFTHDGGLKVAVSAIAGGDSVLVMGTLGFWVQFERVAKVVLGLGVDYGSLWADPVLWGLMDFLCSSYCCSREI